MTYKKDEKKKDVKEVLRKVYMIIDNQKHYIDPEMVTKYGLDKGKVSPVSSRKLYVEKG